MEAKDTVMSDERVLEILAKHPTPITLWKCNYITQAQAEISFKAGYEQHQEESNKALEILEKEIQEKLDEEHKAGIREVVEWIKDTELLTSSRFVMDNLWRAKLKEWGIENE